MSFIEQETASGGRMEGERRVTQHRQKAFLPQAVHTLSGVLDMWVTVYMPEDLTVLILLFHCGDKEIRNGYAHFVKQKTYIWWFHTNKYIKLSWAIGHMT